MPRNWGRGVVANVIAVGSDGKPVKEGGSAPDRGSGGWKQQ